MIRKREETKQQKMIGYLGFAVMGSVIFWLYMSDRKEQEHIRQVMKGEPYAVISVSELLADRSGEYDKKVVVLEGVILSIWLVGEDNRLELSIGPEEDGRQVRATLDASKWLGVLKAYDYRVGDMVCLKGYVWGSRTITKAELLN